MSFEVGVVARFSARHQLVGNFGPASQPHAHDYRVEAVAASAGAALQTDGTLFDISILQTTLRAALETLDGRDLNQLPRLAEPNPTAEVVARHLFEAIAPALRNTGVDMLTVSAWESDAAYAAHTDQPAATRS